MITFFIIAGFILYLLGAGWWFVDVIYDRAPLHKKWHQQVGYQRVYTWMQIGGFLMFIVSIITGGILKA